MDGWQESKESVGLALSSRRSLRLPVLCLASLRQELRLPSPQSITEEVGSSCAPSFPSVRFRPYT